MSTEENRLAASISKGEEEAFKIAFQLYYGSLVQYGIHLLKDKEGSRELVQEVFLKLWENRKSTEIRSSLKAYLFTAMHNMALNHIRKLRYERAFKEYHWREWLDAREGEFQAAPFLRDALHKAIQQLPPKARECFSLTQLEGLSIKEASERMDISEKTAENQLARSRKILQKSLKKYR